MPNLANIIVSDDLDHLNLALLEALQRNGALDNLPSSAPLVGLKPPSGPIA